MASKAEETLRKRKEAKQKKLLLLLVPVLLLLVGFQAPKLLKGDKSAEPAATDTTGAETGAVSTDAEPAAGAPTSGTPITPGAAPVTPGTPSAPGLPTGPAVQTVEKLADLPDSDQPLDAGEGQLISFSRFTAHDPFVQLVTPPAPVEDSPDATPPAEPPAPTETTGGGDTSGGTTDGGDVPSAIQAAVLQTNGVKETVPINGVFPSSDPAFRLVGIEDDGKTARIGLVEGSYSSGGETIAVKLGETIVLVSQPDGYRYTIEFQNVAADPGTPEPGATTTPAS